MAVFNFADATEHRAGVPWLKLSLVLASAWLMFDQGRRLRTALGVGAPEPDVHVPHAPPRAG